MKAVTINQTLVKEAWAALQRKPILLKVWFTSSKDKQGYEARVTREGEVKIYHRDSCAHIATVPFLDGSDFAAGDV